VTNLDRYWRKSKREKERLKEENGELGTETDYNKVIPSNN